MYSWSIAILLAGYIGYQASAEQRICSSFCSSLGMLESNPGKSCDDVYQINKESRGVSGLYWIQTSTGVHEVYCDMELECGGQKGGWMRVVSFDTNNGDNCPTGWSKITAPGTSFDVCRSPNNNPGCYPVTFTTNGTSYNKICGQVRGYQKGSPDAFEPSAFGSQDTIDSSYADGILISVGSPRKHVWAYVVGDSDNTHSARYNCPCSTTPGGSPPWFVMNHYYCGSGNLNPGGGNQGLHYVQNQLWDTEGCVATSNCCSQLGPPWFYREFVKHLTDEDMEARMCNDMNFGDEGTLVEVMQLFVK